MIRNVSSNLNAGVRHTGQQHTLFSSQKHCEHQLLLDGCSVHAKPAGKCSALPVTVAQSNCVTQSYMCLHVLYSNPTHSCGGEQMFAVTCPEIS